MRNQFGGHAVQTSAPPRRPPTSRTAPSCTSSVLSLHDFRSYAAAEVTLPPGVTVVRRPQRAGQDQPGRGGRLHRPAVLAPGRQRRAAGAVRRRPGGDPGRRGPRRPPALLEIEINPGPLQPGPGQPSPLPGPASCSAWSARCCSPPRTSALVKGDPSDRRRFLDDLLVQRRRASPASGPTTTGCSSSATRLLKTAGDARWRPSAAPESGAAHPGRVGLPPRPRSAPSCSRPGSPWSRTCGRWSARPTRRWPAAPPATTPCLQAVVRAPRRRPGGRPDAAGRGAARRARATSRRRARPRDQPGRAAPRRARCSARAAAGEGLRQPRRVVVLRARAAARLVRPAPERTATTRS